MMLNLFSYVIIPAYTVLFAKGTDLFTLNFSVIGSWASKKNAFLLWGILVGAYFYVTLRGITKKLSRPGREFSLCVTALILLAMAVTTPYLPGQFPFRSFLHVIFAFTASVLLLLCLYGTVWKLYLSNKAAYKPYLTGLAAITAVSALLLAAAGIVSSALEIFFTVSCVILVRQLYARVKILSCS